MKLSVVPSLSVNDVPGRLLKPQAIGHRHFFVSEFVERALLRARAGSWINLSGAGDVQSFPNLRPTLFTESLGGFVSYA
jgi:hypothetical protein